MEERQRPELAWWLLRQVAAGQLSQADLKAVLAAWPPPPAAGPVLPGLLAELGAAADPKAQALRQRLFQLLLAQAAECHLARRRHPVTAAAWPELADLPLAAPLGWQDEQPFVTETTALFTLTREYFWLRQVGGQVPVLQAAAAQAWQEAQVRWQRWPGRWDYLAPAADETDAGADDPLAELAIIYHQRAAQELASGPCALPLAPGLEEGAVLIAALDQLAAAPADQHGPWLDFLLAWPTDRLSELLPGVCTTLAQRERAMLVLMLRFGRGANRDWQAWLEWLREQAAGRAAKRAGWRPWRARFAPLWQLLLLREADPTSPALPALEAATEKLITSVDLPPLIARYRAVIPAEELALLSSGQLGGADAGALPMAASVSTAPAARPAAPAPALALTPAKEAAFARLTSTAAAPTAPPVATPLPVAAPVAAAPRPPAPVRPPPPPPPPPQPSVWREHLQPFLVTNWYLVAGLLMVVLGASLLVYFSWDHPWLRLALLPLTLGAFTFGLAWLGTLMTRSSAALAGTAAMLRGGAICLLPINFMMLALLQDQGGQSWRLPALIGGTVGYAALFGWGVANWCRATHPALLRRLLPPLLGLNLLLPGTALAVLAGLDATTALSLAAYLGLALAAWAITGFLRDDLTRELDEARTIPWFFGGTLAATFVEVLACAHGVQKTGLIVADHGPLVLLAGALVLQAERATLRVRGASTGLGRESFLGYAAILLGVIMSVGDPWLRVLVLVLAGLVWLYQATFRTEPVHQWLGLTLLSLAVASLSVVPGFPRGQEAAATDEWWLHLGQALLPGDQGAVTGRPGHLANLLPILGLAWVGLLGLLRVGARRAANLPLSRAAASFQPLILLITVVVAVTSQWQTSSAPWHSGAVIAFAGFIFMWRAWRQQHLGWVHTGMAMLAVALPYLGCMDLPGAHGVAEAELQIRGNTMIAGLALLSTAWLIWLRLAPAPLWLRARSSVLWLYGFLALLGMLVRVVMQDTHAPGGGWGGVALDQGGPLLEAVCLGCAAYYSRSLWPGFGAAFILAVLFPELKAFYQELFPQIAWGSGLVSASSAVALVLISFYLRTWPRLAALGEGDTCMDLGPFPQRRHDHTLFTWPILGAAMFLAMRILAWKAPQLIGGAIITRHLQVTTTAAVLVAALAWALLAVYLRAQAAARAATVLSLLATVLGSYCAAYYWPATPAMGENRALAVLLTLQGLYLLYAALRPRWPWLQDLLAAPTAVTIGVLAGLTTGIIAVTLASEDYLLRLAWLIAVVAAQLAWLGYTRRQVVYGWLLMLLTVMVTLAYGSQGVYNLGLTLTMAHNFTPVLVLLLALQALALLLEGVPAAVYDRVRPLWRPAQITAYAGALVTGFVAVAYLLDYLEHAAAPAPLAQYALLFTVALLTARAERSPLALLLGVAVAYEWLISQCYYNPPTIEYALRYGLARPWHLGALALLLALLGASAGWLTTRWPQLLGARALVPQAWPRRLVWLLPASLLAGWAVVGSVPQLLLDYQAQDLAGAYIGALTLAVAGLGLVPSVWMGLALAGLLVANELLARFAYHQGGWGELDISLIQMLAMGLALTGLQSWLAQHLVGAPPAVSDASAAPAPTDDAARLRAWWQRVRPTVWQWLDGVTLLAATGVLVLLAFNYVAHEDVAAFTWRRLVVSGVLALLAAGACRQAARRADVAGRTHEANLLSAGTFFGMTLALWCLALLIPALRTPTAALWALAVAPLYFYVRAEAGHAAALGVMAVRYRHAASALALAILGLYVLKAAFQMILFPHAPLDYHYYHVNALLVVLISVLLFRLHGLGGHWWLAFYGGVALVTGSYFAVTALPGLSPFTDPMPGAWVGLVLAHFFIALSAQRSPLRTFFTAVGALSEEDWVDLRRYWGHTLQAAGQLLIVLGILDAAHAPWQVALLLAGAASLALHHHLAGGPRWYAGIAAAELLLALHADFFRGWESYLPKEQVIWVFIGAWLVLDAAWTQLSRRVNLAHLSAAAAGCAGLAGLHVLYHHPASTVGLWAVALMTLLALASPVTAATATSPRGWLAAALPVLAPTWLVYFSQTRYEHDEWHDILATWPLLTGLTALVLTGWGARVVAANWAHMPAAPSPTFLWRRTWLWLTQRGTAVQPAALTLAVGVAALLALTHHEERYTTPELLLSLALWLFLAWRWFHVSHERPSLVLHLLWQGCIFIGFMILRGQLMLKPDPVWTVEYDVWASLAVSFMLTGAKPALDRQPPDLKRSMLITMALLPMVAVLWVYLHHLGPDYALLVVGLYTVMYAFLGRGDRESPYHAVAVGGMVAFTLVLFWSKLHWQGLHMLHAYVVPVCLGILALLQLFRARLAPDVRNSIRMVALLAMLGTTGFAAIVYDDHPLGYHFTMLLLCLLAMGLGGFLRVRIYVVLGFAALVVDLAAIVVKVIRALGPAFDKPAIGLLLLLIGVAVVGGTAYVKTHAAEVDEKLAHWRAKLGDWE